MGFIKIHPYGSKMPTSINTTANEEIQLWQELTMLRHVTGPNAIYAKQTIAPWIDQAKIYFLDACNNNWKSAGLLYYYSFLNLAKAFLVANRAVSGQSLKSVNIYHGLSANPQNPNQIVNFKIEIHPPIVNGKRNIFSQFYQKLVKEPWPFPNTISVNIGDIISYCEDISHEINIFYGINKRLITILSLLREAPNNKSWFELLVHDANFPVIHTEIAPSIELVTNMNGITDLDKRDWRQAYNLSPTELFGHSLIRINQINYDAANKAARYQQLITNITNCFRGYILPCPRTNSYSYPYWHFTPKASINANAVKWHPLLSNYLFAFALSTILRYHPHLFEQNNKDSFIAEAWCNQSATTSLRYFLMEFTKQHLRIN